MGYKEMYQSWLDNPYFDEDTKAELKSIAGDDKAGVWYRRFKRRDRSRNEPYEHLYGP